MSGFEESLREHAKMTNLKDIKRIALSVAEEITIVRNVRGHGYMFVKGVKLNNQIIREVTEDQMWYVYDGGYLIKLYYSFGPAEDCAQVDIDHVTCDAYEVAIKLLQ